MVTRVFCAHNATSSRTFVRMPPQVSHASSPTPSRTQTKLFNSRGIASLTLRMTTPDIVEAMLQFLYTGTYSDLPKSRDSLCSVEINVRVFSLAERYKIHELLPVAAEKYVSAAKRTWGTDGFATSIVDVYTKTTDSDNTLRDAVLSIIATPPRRAFQGWRTSS